ncbi:preprotein translocase subunit YajC [Bacillus velezensis]|nr:preprotein translocase subunit YajC [Bacillus velezensis]
MGTLGTIVPIILMFAVLYFLLIRPQQKQQKAVRQMQEELKKGDSVVTIGGLHGTVDSIDESKVVIKIIGTIVPKVPICFPPFMNGFI